MVRVVISGSCRRKAISVSVFVERSFRLLLRAGGHGCQTEYAGENLKNNQIAGRMKLIQG